MAELHRVEINEKAPNEIEPEEAQTDEVTETTEEQQTERPPWLPEKFKSAEDMANAYSELEKKLGQPASEEQQQEEEPQQTEETENENDKPEAGNYNENVVEAIQEFHENDGQLSEETYQKLEQVGLPRDLVDSYAEGMAALAEKQQAELDTLTQGNYESMVEWANENLEQEELNTINATVTGPDMNMAKLAVQGLYARYQNATGSRPKTLVQGAVSGSSTMPFKSMQELARAQSDPRYRSGDKAYHQEIDRRLAVSNI
jgi:hypothetical protein